MNDRIELQSVLRRRPAKSLGVTHGVFVLGITFSRTLWHLPRVLVRRALGAWVAHLFEQRQQIVKHFIDWIMR